MLVDGPSATDCKRCVFTIAAGNYLGFVRTLMETVARHMPDADRIVGLCDRGTGRTGEPIEIVTAESLAIPDFERMAFEYNVLELSTAIKPHLFTHLFRERGYDEILYFDPDILVYRDLQPVFGLLRRHSIVLVPHVTAPITEKAPKNEKEILQAGTYNLGFLGLRNDPEVGSLLRWWSSHTNYDCVVDKDQGLFVDQKWMDLVPSLFSGVFVQRDPGWNVGPWNLSQRKVTRQGAEYFVNDRPLVFFHFSGFRPGTSGSNHAYQKVYRGLRGAGRALLAEYEARLDKNMAKYKSVQAYGYGQFADGSAIPDVVRTTYRRHRHEALNRPPLDSTAFKPWLFSFVNEPATIHGTKNEGITRLAYTIFRERDDLRDNFPAITGADYPGFVAWFLSSGKRQYELSDSLVAPMKQRWKKRAREEPLDAAKRARFFLTWYDKMPWLQKLFRKGAGHEQRSRLRKRLIGR